MGWIRSLMRRKTQPIPITTAEIWKRRLSIAYVIIIWNTLGLLFYAAFKKNMPEGAEKLPAAQKYAKILGIKDANVIRINKFTVVDKYEIKSGQKIKKINSEEEEEGAYS